MLQWSASLRQLPPAHCFLVILAVPGLPWYLEMTYRHDTVLLPQQIFLDWKQFLIDHPLQGTKTKHLSKEKKTNTNKQTKQQQKAASLQSSRASRGWLLQGGTSKLVTTLLWGRPEASSWRDHSRFFLLLLNLTGKRKQRVCVWLRDLVRNMKFPGTLCDRHQLCFSIYRQYICMEMLASNARNIRDREKNNADLRSQETFIALFTYCLGSSLEAENVEFELWFFTVYWKVFCGASRWAVTVLVIRTEGHAGWWWQASLIPAHQRRSRQIS